jgi:hypothetical protein
MRASVGWQTMVLSYQPWAPSQLRSVPPSKVSLQVAPPFQDTHSSLWEAPSAEANRYWLFTGEMASSKRPLKSAMPVFTYDQVQPWSVDLRMPAPKTVAYCTSKSVGSATSCRMRGPPKESVPVSLCTSVQVAPPSRERKMLLVGYSAAL